MLWFHIPSIIIVYGTSNGPQKDLGNIFRPLYCGDFAGHLERRVQGLG